MKNVYKWLIGIFAILFLVVGGLFFFTPVFQIGLSSTFTPVYCNDPTSACCVKTSSTSTISLSGSSATACSPTSTVTTCDVDKKSGYYLYYGSTNCRVVQDISTIFIKQYRCDNQVSYSTADVLMVSVPRGYQIYSDRSATASMTTFGEKLVTNLGAFIQGSCVFSSSAGQKITNNNGVDFGASYTVPVGEGIGTKDSCVLTWNAGNRHICGNLEEQCTADSDCIGHTFGNKECTNRVLQTYGCTELGVPSSLSYGFDGADASTLFAPIGSQNAGANAFSGVTSRCEIKSATPVQCCGDTDCGSSMVCDKTTFTCKAPEKVGCTASSQCGVSTQCDYASLQLKTPKCTIVGFTGTCGYSTKPVQCCNDGNCASTQTCDLASYTCKDKAVVKTLCAFECCVGDALYLDRACSSGFCVNHACSVEPECSATKPCVNNLDCKDGVCKPVVDTCKDSFFGLVKADIGTKEECNFLCKVGLKSPEKVNVCVKDYTPLALVLIFVIALGGMITYGVTRNKKGGRKSSGKGTNIFRTKWFWRLLIGIAVFVLLILYFKFIFWMLLGILVIFILDAIFLHGVIRRIVFW